MVNKCCDNSNMTTAQIVLLRASIVLGMVAAVVTILYFTPMPDQNFKSCDRPCHELDWPMICRVKLNIEMYQTMSGVCEDCPYNTSHCNNKYCNSADGVSRGIITANRQLPGPSIQVCQNDVLVVDVINKIPGHSLTVHWRGQPNHEAPFMDGVPMVTQCPISSYTTFQYKFRASSAGTHFYHAHDDSDRSDGLFGALIVRQADKLEPHRKLYDYDSKDHIVLISEWSSGELFDKNDYPKSLLINGRAPTGSGVSLATFNVNQGKRYRFRVAYTGGNVGCPITLTIDKHLMKIIALDGNPTAPYEVNSVTLSKGERLDFVLKTNQEVDKYFMKVKSECNDKAIEGLALIKYNGIIKFSKEFNDAETKIRHFNTALCQSKIGSVCLGDVKSLEKIPKQLRNEEVDRQIYLGFNFTIKQEVDEDYDDLRSKVYTINNLTFTYPSSPLLTQLDDLSINAMCNELTLAEKCNKTERSTCECVHLEHIPLGMTAEILLIDQGGDEAEHIFHLHGYHFYVVGIRQFESSQTIDEIKNLDKQNLLFKRNLNNPVLKDTVRVPRFGAVAIRLIANNPGFWILRDEQSRGWTRGLDIVLQVGDTSEMVTSPTNFPTCGSFVGPDFFLI